MNYDFVPKTLIGLGLALGGLFLAQLSLIALSSAPLGIVPIANLASSLVFIAILVGGGYWLLESPIEPDRYRRIAVWVVAGFAFLFSFFALVAIFTQEELLARIGVMYWGAAAGTGLGALVGIFEARAINRAIVAERSRLRGQELQRRNDRLEEFASIISHDLRNPLAVAMGNIELAGDSADEKYLRAVESALGRMEQIIEETLELARSGQTIDEPGPVSLAELAQLSWSNVPTDEATLKIETDTSIEADRDRLQHLLENLFRNAVEHGGGATVTVRIGALPDGFYVEDDGPGIPKPDRQEIFDAGFSTSEDGIGFGLAIVSQIVSAHRWSIDVSESETGGARFEITGVDKVSAVEPESSHPVAL